MNRGESVYYRTTEYWSIVSCTFIGSDAESAGIKQRRATQESHGKGKYECVEIHVETRLDTE